MAFLNLQVYSCYFFVVVVVILFCFRPQRKGDSYGKDEMKGQEIDRKEGEVK